MIVTDSFIDKSLRLSIFIFIFCGVQVAFSFQLFNLLVYLFFKILALWGFMQRLMVPSIKLESTRKDS